MSGKDEELGEIRDHLIVCGYGDVGRTIAQELLLGNEKIVVIDSQEESFSEDKFDFPFIIGDATKEETLERGRVKEAKGLFAALKNDPDNILLTLSARDLNPDLRIVARAGATEAAKHLRRAGAESVVLPDAEGGIKMARSFLHPEITSLYDHLMMGDVGRVGTVEVTPSGSLEGKTIKESKIRDEVGVSIIAIKRGDELVTNPTVDQEIMGGDVLVVMGSLSRIEKLRKIAREEDEVS